MDNWFEKLSTYNLFNYLLPGIVFMFAMKVLAGWDLNAPNIVVELFLYYFIGLAISRVGSIIIEELLQRIGAVKYADYEDYLKKAADDDELVSIAEQANVYRTMVALILTILVALGVDYLFKINSFSGTTLAGGLLVFLLVLFFLGYLKQNRFVRNRVNSGD